MARLKFNLEVQTENKFVAFLDVLGFKELVFKNNFDALDSYFSKLTSVLDGLREKKKNVESFVISDSIILIAPSGLQSFKELIRAIRTIQSQMIWRGIILRGAVSYGPLYFDGDKNIIVGKGYIRAYLLEQEAIYPRVIIDPAIIKLFKTDKKGFFKQVNLSERYNFQNRLIYEPSGYAKISDDAIFVDYANKVITEDRLSNSIKILYDTILDNLYSEQKLFAKYMWLKEYFLECIQLTHHLTENKIDPDAQVYQKKLDEWGKKFIRL